MGFYKADEGNIYFVNKETEDQDNFSDIGYVPQVSNIIHGTIYDNILLGIDDLSDENFKNICKISCVDDFVKDMKKEYETIIGVEGSVQLSGGQVQRILLARALAKKFEILFLDEFTSALDFAVEEKIIKNLISINKTIIMVAHKKEIIKYCNKTINLFSS